MSNTNREETKMTNLAEQIKSFIDSDTWQIACCCKKCHGIEWIEMPVDDFAELIEAHNVDFSNAMQLAVFNHKILHGKILIPA